ncbi:MAG: hypothetical protein V4489_02965 [Chlamydiota bacterium]
MFLRTLSHPILSLSTPYSKLIKTLVFVFLLLGHFTSSFALTIHIYGEKNGKGLEKDISILKPAITKAGHDVADFSPSYVQSKTADINIFLESLNLDQMKTATHNWFIPNPEWYLQDLALLDNIDLILCRTKEVERIFKDLGKKTYFLGFTSEDCLLDIQKTTSPFFI